MFLALKCWKSLVPVIVTQGTANGLIKENLPGDYHLDPVFEAQLHYCCQAGPTPSA